MDFFLALLKARSEASKFDFQRIGIEYRDVLHCMLGTMYVYLHSSEKRSLYLMKLSSGTIQNLSYFLNTKTHHGFCFSFHAINLMFTA